MRKFKVKFGTHDNPIYMTMYAKNLSDMARLLRRRSIESYESNDIFLTEEEYLYQNEGFDNEAYLQTREAWLDYEIIEELSRMTV
jgi:hypothetical protein